MGNYKGRLRHGGELLRLVDAAGELVDQVDFRAGGDWPLLAHGDGSSLELIHPDMDRSQSSAWAASREAEKAAWRTYACTNTYLELNPIGQPSDYRELHLYLVTEGHVALRNIGLWRNGANFVENAGHMSTNGSSATGWLAQGTHAGTYLTNGELHLVADGRGDVRADRVEIDCPRLRRGQQYELRFEAKWVSGCPRLIAHTWDRSVGSSFLLPCQPRWALPAGPTQSLCFRPAAQARNWNASATPQAVPRSTDTVTVTAQVINPKAGAQVLLFIAWTHRPGMPPGKANRCPRPRRNPTQAPGKPTAPSSPNTERMASSGSSLLRSLPRVRSSGCRATPRNARLYSSLTIGKFRATRASTGLSSPATTSDRCATGIRRVMGFATRSCPTTATT
ncbi:MAG: hypothetical protein U1G07_24940 [Verrucomicrobiota bacterium]